MFYKSFTNNRQGFDHQIDITRSKGQFKEKESSQNGRP